MKNESSCRERELKCLRHVRRTAMGELAGCLAGLALPVALASMLCAQTTNETPNVLARVAQNAGRVASVFTRFTQERHLSLFQEPLRSEGYLCFEKPGRLRWEITEPYQSILVSDGKGVAQFERVNNHWKKLELGLAQAVQNVTAQIGAVMEGRYAAKQQDYTVTATNASGGPVVTLKPRHPAMRKMMQAIEIYLAPDCQGTRRVVLRETGGDFTDIRFSEQVPEPPLPAGTFSCANPTDLDKVREAAQQHKPTPDRKSGTP